jgi:hypothetical protein
MQTRKADRIMAGQNHAERKTGGQSSMILSGHDSVVSGCGFAALCAPRAEALAPTDSPSSGQSEIDKQVDFCQHRQGLGRL